MIKPRCSGSRVGCETCGKAGDTPAATSAFTVIELLIVMAIILVLAGLILATSGYVQKKGARSRTEAEIAAMSAALENYKSDNGAYPTDTATETLDPRSATDPTTYQTATVVLYDALTGNTAGSRTPAASAKSYYTFKPNMLNPPPPSTAVVTSIRDPFGNSYGYSTMKAKTPAGTGGYNPTYDLWSTGGETGNGGIPQWIKNW